MFLRPLDDFAIWEGSSLWPLLFIYSEQCDSYFQNNAISSLNSPLTLKKFPDYTQHMMMSPLPQVVECVLGNACAWEFCCDSYAFNTHRNSPYTWSHLETLKWIWIMEWDLEIKIFESNWSGPSCLLWKYYGQLEVACEITQSLWFQNKFKVFFFLMKQHRSKE